MRRIDRKPTDISKTAASTLSDIRRADIHDYANKQVDKEPVNKIYATSTGKTFTKQASIASPQTPPRSNYSTETLGPEVYSPLFQLANLNLPRDRVTMNAWNRVFYDTHPLVRNGINLHSSYPISKINITSKDKKVQQFFLEMAERIDLYSIVYGVSLEFWKLGEAFPYAELDESMGTWSRITVLNPDYINVNKSIIGNHSQISLKPDASLIRMINSNAPQDVAIRKRLPPHIIDYVRKNMNIPLDDFNISHLKLLSAPYDIRGTSIIVSIYKDLMLYDKLRESKFAQADGMINPFTLVTLGGSNDYRPTQADIEHVKSVLEEAQYNKDFKMVTHEGVKIERVGYNGGITDIASDIEHISNNIYAGLMLPKALIEQEAASYASSSVGLEVLRQRYDVFRNMVKKWLERKIFAPICEIQDFFEYADGEKRLLVPSIDFNHMNLYDMNDYVQQIGQFVGDSKVSVQTLHRSLGLSYEEEQRRIREEMINASILEKEKTILSQMRLSELQSLDPNKPITEPAESTINTDSGDSGLPGVGQDDGGGLPGMDMGGLGAGPDMGAPPDMGGGDMAAPPA